jgi:hypothetical protein
LKRSASTGSASTKGELIEALRINGLGVEARR